MKGKKDQLTYWLTGEDAIMRKQREKERKSRRKDPSASNKCANNHDPLVPRSSLKNKSLVRTSFLRCSSESPKRLRFASSDQLDQKCVKTQLKQLDSIVDSSPCKQMLCSGRLSCLDSLKSSSNSCPCVEKLCEDDHQPLFDYRITINECCPPNESMSDCFVTPDVTFDLDERSSLKLGGLFQGACSSAPSSPRHSAFYVGQKREIHSSDDIDAWEGVTSPLLI